MKASKVVFLVFLITLSLCFVNAQPAKAEDTEYPLPGHYNRTIQSPQGLVSPDETVNLVFIIQQTYEHSLNDYVFTLDQLSDGRSVMFMDAWRNATMWLPDGTKGYITVEPKTDMRKMDCKVIEEVQVPYPPDWPKKATLIGNLGVPLNKTYTVWTIECTASLGVLSVGWHHLIVYWGPYYQDPDYYNGTVYLALAGSTFRVGFPPPTISIVSPEKNVTYSVKDVSLALALSKPAVWIGYSLDGQANMTMTGNTTLSELSYGSHSLVVYANDTYGIMGASETVYFTIAPPSEPPPSSPPSEPSSSEPFPIEYSYGVVTVAAVSIAVVAGYLFFKRKKQGRDK